MSMKAVVVWDPSGELPDGSVLEGNEIAVATGNGVVVLPFHRELLTAGGAGAWSKRCYGRGWRFDQSVSGPGCPLVLQVRPGFQIINWAARLLLNTPESRAAGALRLAGDTTQVGARSFGLALEDGPVLIERVTDRDVQGGIIVRGRNRCSIAGDQIFALQLYGYLSGARVQWLAASQST